MKIEIQTDADFTPRGKRSVRVVRHQKSGKKCAEQIAWYVGQRLYRRLQLNNENIALSGVWKAAQA
jgi:hypothetical protein